MRTWPPVSTQSRRPSSLALLVGLCAVLLSSTAARAATISWNNAAGGAWATASNWSPAVVPSATDDVLITLSGTYNITINTTASAQSVLIGGASGTQTLSGGTLNVSTSFAPAPGTTGGTRTGGSITGTGTVSIPSGATLTMVSASVTVPVSNSGTLIAMGAGDFSGTYTSGIGSTLRLEGSNTVGGVTQTFASGFTNNGTIVFTSTGAAAAATLAVTTGTLTNPSGRSIDVQAGVGGARSLTASLANAGTVSVGSAFTINKVGGTHTNSGTLNVSGGDLSVSNNAAGSFTNTGTLAITAGRTATFTNGTFTHTSGSLTGGTVVFASGNVASLTAAFSLGSITVTSATLQLAPNLATSATTLTATSSTLNGPGTITNSTGVTTAFQSCVVNAPFVNDGTLVLTGTGSVNGSFTTGAGSTLRVEGNNTIGGAAQTFANGFTNNGTLVLTSNGGSAQATLTVTSGALTNPSGRSIDVQAGVGGARTLTASLANSGTVTVGSAFAINKTPGVHTNSGTINVSGGDLTVTNNSSGSFANTGTLAITAGRTATFNNGTFSHTSGTLTGGALVVSNNNVASLTAAFTLGSIVASGATLNVTPNLATSATTLSATSSTLNGPGTVTNSTGVTTTLQSCVVNAPFVNDGTLVLTGTGSVNGSFTTGAGSTLRVEGNNTIGSTAQTFANGFTNNGTLVLTSNGGSAQATLTVTSGALTNPSGRSIDVQAGVGGARTLTASLANSGTVTVGATFTINKIGGTHTNSGTIHVSGGDLTVTNNNSGSFANTGTLAITPGRTVTFNNGTFSHTSGTLTGGALVVSNNNVANLTAAFTLGSISASGATLNVTPNLATSATTLSATSSTLNGPGTVTNSTGVTTTLQSCVVNAPFVNDGTLVLTGSGSVNGSFTSGAGSTLRLDGNNAIGGAVHTFANGFTNNGTIALSSVGGSALATLAVTSGTLTNPSGRSIDVQAGVGGARTLTAALANAGTVTLGAAFTINKVGGTHTNSGTIDVSGGDLTVTNNVSGSFTNTGTLAIASGRTATFNNGTFSHASGTLSGGALVAAGGNVSNLIGASSLGSITASGATLNLTPDLVTSTTALSGVSSTINGPGSITNSIGVTTALQSCSVNAPFVNDGTLVLSGSGTVNGSFASGAGSTLRLEANNTVGGALHTFANGFTNNGTIALTSVAAAAQATLAIVNGTLTNPSGRLIDVQLGAGGARTITASLANAGTLTVGTALTLNKSPGTHTNSGTIQVSGGNLSVTNNAAGSFGNTGTFEISPGRTATFTNGSFTNDVAGTIQGGGTLDAGSTTFTQAGTVRPGSSAGLLSIVGAFAPTSTAQLAIELGGTTAGAQYDRLTSTLPMTFDGTLDLSLIGGFTPVAGQTFRVLAGAPVRAGRFAHITGTIDLGGGLALEPQYSDSGLVLQVVSRTWVRQLPDGGRPLARDGHSAVLDPGTGRMIVFGGDTGSGVLNDVWILRDADAPTGSIPEWIALSPAGTPPAARTHAACAYDPASNRLVVFGGDDGAATPAVYSDVWVLTNANGLGGTPTWSALVAAGGPGARTGAAAAYDAANKRLLVFGGSATGACSVASNDAWVLANADGTGPASWTALAPTGVAPSARAFARTSYDAAHNRLLLFSGLAPCGAQDVDSWALTNANGIAGTPAWVALSPTGAAPAASAMQAVAYEPATDRLTVFGGLEGATPSARLSSQSGASGFSAPPTWSDAPASSFGPSARSEASAVAGTDRIVFFGGRTVSGRSNEVFTLETDRGRVLDVTPEPPALPRRTGFARAAWPNPGHGSVHFGIAVDRDQPVKLEVCDVAGRRVTTLQNGVLAAGMHAFEWNGLLPSGNTAPAGVYFVRLSAVGVRSTQRVLRLP